jgi:hypothetical protein
VRRIALFAAAAIAAGGCGSNAAEEPNPFPAVPEIGGLSLAEAFDKLAATGWDHVAADWQPDPSGPPTNVAPHALYNTYSARGTVGPRRYDEFKVVCGGHLDIYYLLHVYVARRSSECRELAARVRPAARIVLVDRRQHPPQYFAVWGQKEDLWVHAFPSLPELSFDVLIEPGTCAHPATARAYHAGGVTTATLRATTWALRWGPTRMLRPSRCMTHFGTHVLPSDTSTLPDLVRARQIEPSRVVLKVRFNPGRVVLQKLGAGRTRITPDLWIDALSAIHLRPGTCTQIRAPEIPLDSAGQATVVAIPFERITRTPHVIELHRLRIGAVVGACVRIDGPPK